MNKLCKAAGKMFLSIASKITAAGVASAVYYGVEEMPESMKCKR